MLFRLARPTIKHFLALSDTFFSAQRFQRAAWFSHRQRKRDRGRFGAASSVVADRSPLVQRLEAKDLAANDLWEEAIGASLRFTNELANSTPRA
jgi:hypothetical protein